MSSGGMPDKTGRGMAVTDPISSRFHYVSLFYLSIALWQSTLVFFLNAISHLSISQLLVMDAFYFVCRFVFSSSTVCFSVLFPEIILLHVLNMCIFFFNIAS